MEPDGLNHQALTEVLKAEGLHVLCFSSVHEAARQLRLWRPVAVLVHRCSREDLDLLGNATDAPLVAVSAEDVDADAVLPPAVELDNLLETIRALSTRMEKMAVRL